MQMEAAERVYNSKATEQQPSAQCLLQTISYVTHSLAYTHTPIQSKGLIWIVLNHSWGLSKHAGLKGLRSAPIIKTINATQHYKWNINNKLENNQNVSTWGNTESRRRASRLTQSPSLLSQMHLQGHPHLPFLIKPRFLLVLLMSGTAVKTACRLLFSLNHTQGHAAQKWSHPSSGSFITSIYIYIFHYMFFFSFFLFACSFTADKLRCQHTCTQIGYLLPIGAWYLIFSHGSRLLYESWSVANPVFFALGSCSCQKPSAEFS